MINNWLFSWNSISSALRMRRRSVIPLPNLFAHALSTSLHPETHPAQASVLHPELPRVQGPAQIENIGRRCRLKFWSSFSRIHFFLFFVLFRVQEAQVNYLTIISRSYISPIWFFTVFSLTTEFQNYFFWFHRLTFFSPVFSIEIASVVYFFEGGVRLELVKNRDSPL